MIGESNCETSAPIGEKPARMPATASEDGVEVANRRFAPGTLRFS